MRRLGRATLECVILVALAIPVAYAAPTSSDAARDEIFQPFGRWNGKRIYLSPARHQQPPRARGECGPRSEDQMAYWTAWSAANTVYFNDRYAPNSRYRNLRSRGYRVRIGRGTYQSAVANSNAWGATRHVVLHSNAHAFNNCGNTNAPQFGTHGIYKPGSTPGYDLSQKLTHTIGVDSTRGPLRSPGTNDKACIPSNCSQYDSLYELSYSRAPAAYMEVEFHTWTRGYNWIDGKNTIWAWRIGWGIDWHLGWPRR
jgi:hypothetical protein